MKNLILSVLILSLSFPSLASKSKYVPLDIEDGMWEVKFDFENMLSAQQKIQIKQALEKLEEMKKKNPAMAAQLSQMTESMGVSSSSVTKTNCIDHSNMKDEMDSMLNGESSSEVKCKGEILKSTPKMIEGRSVCGDKIHKYKITVQDRKHMTSVVTTADGKTLEASFKWLDKECTPESKSE